eukprot:11650367-Alexandrium_andersonii.AAC.1
MAPGSATGPSAGWPMGAGAACGPGDAATSMRFPTNADLNPPNGFAPVVGAYELTSAGARARCIDW